MSATRSKRRLLTSSVALAAAGSVALAPLAPAAQEVANVALEPVTIRVGANAEYTRVEFAGVVGSRAQVRREGNQVVVRIGTTAAPDVARLRVDPPPGVASVETRSVASGTELVLTLAEGGTATTGSADGAVWLNLYGQAPDGSVTSAGAAHAALAVQAQASADKVEITFPWTKPVAAAVFRRGGSVWVVFNQPAQVDMTHARSLGPAHDARWQSGDQSVALRLAADESLPVSATAHGNSWTVTIGGEPSAVSSVNIQRDDAQRTTLVAQMAGASSPIWLTDPVSGERFAAVPALAPGKGLAVRRQSIDMTLLPTAHGLAIETPASDLIVRADGDLVSMSRPKGLILSPPSAEVEAGDNHAGAPQKAPHPSLILEEWGQVGSEGFLARRRTLLQAASDEAGLAVEDPRSPIEARLAYARFLLGSGLGFEAIGVLNAIVDTQPNMVGEAEVRGLRGAARVSVGRLDDALADFSSGVLADDPAAQVWRGYVSAQQDDFVSARQAFTAGAGVVDSFPAEWRARFGTAHARAALETGDVGAARSLLAYALSQPIDAADQLSARLIQARLFEIEGQSDRALAVYAAIGRAPLDGLATPARLGVVRLSLAKGSLTPTQAAKELESLRWRWRGDRTELEVIRELGKLYLSQGLYREALTALKAAGPRMSRIRGGAELQTDLNEAFRALFLEGGADGLQPIQALGLFYDFRELTPVGADGDEMVRRLAKRLVAVDLLDQAAELLKYQVDERLDGVAKAQVATDLAAIYLMDRQPEPALQALWGSRSTLLPSAMQAERRALEARALMDLNRLDHALEVLGRDASPAAQAVRADIYFKQEKWKEAAALYEAALGRRYADTANALTPGEEANLLRAGIGFSLGHDNAALERLMRNYRPLLDQARSKDALYVALTGFDSSGQTVSLAALTASADTFTAWVTGMKARFRSETGGGRPATPARPSSSAPAPNPAPAQGAARPAPAA